MFADKSTTDADKSRITPASGVGQGFVLQRKLEIGAVNDPLELEADVVAEKVMRMSEKPFVQRKCSRCEEDDKIVQRRPLVSQITPYIQRRSSDGSASLGTSISNRIESTFGAGTPLPEPTRSFMENRFGTEFSNVRIHADHDSAQLSHSLNAQAFTVGKDIYFNEGKYTPDSESGRYLLAHELTHTLQQREVIDRKIQRRVDNVEINCADGEIRFIHDGITTAYHLDHCQVSDNTYDAGVSLGKHTVKFDLGSVSEGTFFDFNYSIAPGQPSPNTFFAGQKRVNITCSNTPSAPGIQGAIHFKAKQLSVEEVLAFTGQSVESIPEGIMLPLSRLINRSLPSVVGPSVAGASHFSPTPWSFIPRNTTGILWVQGHTSAWSNPEGLFSTPTIKGYRGNLGYYAGELLPFFGRRITVKLNEGVPGSFANDAWFPLMKGDQYYVFTPRSTEQARAFAERIQATEYGGDYTYSPPRAPGAADPVLGEVKPKEASLYTELTARGRAPMCTNNCITVPAPEIEAAMGGRPTTPGGVDVMTGRGPDGTVDPHYAGRGKLMTSAVSEGPLPSGAQRLQIQVTPGGSAGMFLIRGAGRVMLVYGVYHTEERVRESIGTGHTATVVTEEAGSWTGAILGSALGGAAAGAILCSPTGPVDAVCVVGGFVGGLLFGAVGGTVGHAGGHEVGERVVTPIVDSVMEKGAEVVGEMTRGIYSLYGVPYF
ncbi:MAG: DUF4157 domain-containing protein [Chlorobiaceae bacterium]|nr:DUF4157 domain-containing protein [Chlorobiaceae bacterium]